MKQTNFGQISSKLSLPDLLDMQKESFVDFLQLDVAPTKRELKGLQAAFEDVFPIEAPDGSMKLEFVKYELGAPRYSTPQQAALRDGTYSAPMKAVMRLSVKKRDGKLKEASEQDVTLCDLPLMTDAGCFVFNGAERVVVSQLHRSPGIIFEEDEEKKQSTLGKKLYVARIIPYRGAWIEFSFDIMNALWVRIDRKKKVLATTFLRACGLETNAQIIQAFYDVEDVEVKPAEIDNVVGRYAADDIVDPATGEVLWNLDDKAAMPMDDKIFKEMVERKIKKVKIISGNPRQDDPGILATLENRKDQIRTSKEAQADIYKKMRGQDFVVKEQAEAFLDNLIFDNIRRYDLSYVGRYKINKKFASLFDIVENLKFKKFTKPTDKRRTLSAEDIIVTVKYLLALNAGEDAQKMYGEEIIFKTDDIDHLGNRRVRGIGELLENQIRVGLSQMAKTARDRMNKELASHTPRALVNAQPVQAIIKKFFGTSQLSQFMDQINPLSELTHKRRLSALGPGGLNRKRAGFEVRDVHHTHYGRVCPIETPEGPNIGLITSLACYSKVNKYGLIETPYRKVNSGKVTDNFEYLTADQEDDLMVAQSNTPLTDSGKINTDMVSCRVRSDYPIVSPSEVDYMDVSPLQVISVSAALIPFLEHDDANRALMGCNMQRQGVPLLLTEAPLVGTGIEHEVARDSGATISAAKPGRVVFAAADKIAVEPLEGGAPEIYDLIKYKRSNQDTCINQRPLVKAGDIVKKGTVLADGPAMKDGFLALGKNLLVGFMSWEGYNYEDAILVSHKLVKEDVFTSVHLHEFSIDARNTKLGAEEITRDIPNIGAEALAHLDADGIVIPSTVVEPGDILVGKVTPKGEQQLTPEERLLKVIFGKKADDVVDASLRVPPGTSGKVIGTRVFVRKEKLTKAEEKARIKALEDEKTTNLETLKEQRKLALTNIKDSNVKDAKKEEERINALYKKLEKRVLEDFEREMEFSKQGDELAVTVNKSVKVFIASKRKLMVGDKLSGRHGNKGVVAKILPEEDMPFLPDGTPLDIVLSPLGIPSRMNVGQLFETMLGWAAKNLGYNAATPVFDGPTEETVREEIKKAKKALIEKGVPEKHLPDDYCRITLYDGRTGQPFEEKVTIGYMYIMKLIHLVEDKVHARSTGPYSLITRQPLGGKAQFGGQRFGEMEVWAIEGYGATYTLQEFLTVKSDDFTGRTKMYESIVRGEAPQQPGVPESFKVLVKELQALGLSVELLKDNQGQAVEEMTVASIAKEIVSEETENL
ncbi:DNA-directed RNA polymerase, beta subunit [Elusimicrobium minutum Pei191]|uniref:DNA-directed RNA polymerase subunit beta n=1 Tax=Elusimicrobium minutum (strain Pei191) TaxID=445932 RepID=B2KEN1_ELUMP|nr:DNA-directed RNA polymerase subunit beta [Elusimicrobium minutum]ACC98977.1 DNA-directed RNA polymerase, beta subunit [Elusimicrobium minutum Pei191]